MAESDERPPTLPAFASLAKADPGTLDSDSPDAAADTSFGFELLTLRHQVNIKLAILRHLQLLQLLM